MNDIVQAFDVLKIKKLIKLKVSAVYTTLIAIYLMTITFMFLVFNNIFKMGYKLPIQISRRYSISIYNYDFSNAFYMQIILGITSILAIAMIAMIINRFTAHSITSILVNGIIVCIPIIIEKTYFFPLWFRKWVSIQPINGAFMENNLISQQIYRFFGVEFLKIPNIIIINMMIIIFGFGFINSKIMRRV